MYGVVCLFYSQGFELPSKNLTERYAPFRSPIVPSILTCRVRVGPAQVSALKGVVSINSWEISDNLA